MQNQTYRWVKIANSVADLRFGSNQIAEVTVEQKAICIINTKDGFKACAGTCPHAGAPLRDGVVDSRGNILCSVHNYRFSLTRGRDPFNEFRLKIFPVKVEEDGIFLGFQETPVK